MLTAPKLRSRRASRAAAAIASREPLHRAFGMASTEPSRIFIRTDLLHLLVHLIILHCVVQ